MMKKKWVNFLLLNIITVCCVAQTAGYKFYSRLDSVTNSGFYNIAVTPELSSHLNLLCTDLRIINETGMWIPHIHSIHVPAWSNDFTTLNLKYTKTTGPDSETILVIENARQPVSAFGLIISNTAAERSCMLSGSNDKSDWFVISDSIALKPDPSKDSTENTLYIDLPATDYRFYKLEIMNSHKAPFNITGLVQFTEHDNVQEHIFHPVKNPDPAIVQKDSGKISYIKVTQSSFFHFDKIKLGLDGIKYYNRKVSMYIPLPGSPHSFTDPGQLVESFTISSNSIPEFNVRLSKAQVFYLLISNEDNPPVSCKEVSTFLNPQYITAYLEKGSSYRLIMDNAAATSPDYDLSELYSGRTDSFPFLGFGKIIHLDETTAARITSEKNNTWILWILICVVLGILLYFTNKMIHEVNKREKNDHI